MSRIPRGAGLVTFAIWELVWRMLSCPPEEDLHLCSEGATQLLLCFHVACPLTARCRYTAYNTSSGESGRRTSLAQRFELQLPVKQFRTFGDLRARKTNFGPIGPPGTAGGMFKATCILGKRARNGGFLRLNCISLSEAGSVPSSLVWKPS